MERLNKSGRTLLEYRSEFKKHYSDSIDESLKEAVNILYNEKKIDEKIFRNILNENISDDDFEIMLSKRKEFTKNTSELNYEFDLVRKKINEYMIDIGFTTSMNTKNSLDINKIIIIHQFDLNRNYIMSSFGVNQTEIIPLMKRRGFVEKFAVLRLNQVLKEIYGEMKMPEDIDHGYSLVYYNKKTQSFSIDYKFYINVDVASDEKRMKELINKIRELDKVIDKKFHTKLGNSYFNEPKNNTSTLKMGEAEKPVVKQTQIQPVKNVVEKAQKNKNQQKKDETTKTTKSTIPADDAENPIPKKSQPVYQLPDTQDTTSTTPSKTEDKHSIKDAPKKEEKKKTESFDDIEIEFDVSDKDLL